MPINWNLTLITPFPAAPHGQHASHFQGAELECVLACWCFNTN
jgi:hypothetical protein